MTNELSQLILSKNACDLREKNNSPVLVNSETNRTTLWSYFESKMAENKCISAFHSTVNSILTQYIDQHYLGGSKDIIFWEANRLIFPEL